MSIDPNSADPAISISASTITTPPTTNHTNLGNAFTATAVTEHTSAAASKAHHTAQSSFGSAGAPAILASHVDSKHSAANSTSTDSPISHVQFTSLNDDVRQVKEETESRAKEIIALNKENEFKEKLDQFIVSEHKIRVETQISSWKCLAIVAIAVTILAVSILFPPAAAGIFLISFMMSLKIGAAVVGFNYFIKFIHSFNINVAAEERFRLAIGLFKSDSLVRKTMFEDTHFKNEVERIKNDYTDISTPGWMETIKGTVLNTIGSEYNPEPIKADYNLAVLEFDSRFVDRVQERKLQLNKVLDAEEEYSKAIKDCDARAAKAAAGKFIRAKQNLIAIVSEENQFLQQDYHLAPKTEVSNFNTAANRAFLNFEKQITKIRDNTPFEEWPLIEMTQPEHVRDICRIKQDYAYDNSRSTDEEVVYKAAKKWKESLSVDQDLYNALKARRKLDKDIPNLSKEYDILRKTGADRKAIQEKARELGRLVNRKHALIVDENDHVNANYHYKKSQKQRDEEEGALVSAIINFDAKLENAVNNNTEFPEVPQVFLTGYQPPKKDTVEDYDKQIEGFDAEINKLTDELASKEKSLKVPPNPPLASEKLAKIQTEVAALKKQITRQQAEKVERETLKANLVKSEADTKAKLDAARKAKADADAKAKSDQEAARLAKQKDDEAAKSKKDNSAAASAESDSKAKSDASVTPKVNYNLLTTEEIRKILIEKRGERTRKEDVGDIDLPLINEIDQIQKILANRPPAL